MADFTTGSVTTVTLASSDTIVISGTANVSVSVARAAPSVLSDVHTESVNTVGRFGPYGSSATLTIVGLSAGSYVYDRSGDITPSGPILLTAAQIASPTGAILADTTASYIGPAPNYYRYVSNGVSLVLLSLVNYTWATLPLASAYIGNAFVSDIGAHGSVWRSDGSTWGVVGGTVVLSDSAVVSTTLTGSTSFTALSAYTVPAGLMGLNGALDIELKVSCNSSAGTKTTTVTFGGGGVGCSITVTTSQSIGIRCNIQNRNSASSQLCSDGEASGFTLSNNVWTTTSLDTSIAQNLFANGQLSNGADNMKIESFRVVLQRP